LHWGTLHKSIARHPIGTMTHSDMVDHIADGIVATGSGTGISAFLLYTGQISGTLRTENTLGSAGHVGITLIVGHTCALSLIGANGITAAGTGVAWISWLFTGWWCCKGVLVLVQKRV